MENTNWGPHKCPVCGKYTFPSRDSYDVCDVCDWTDNWFQDENPDEGGLENCPSQNQAKKLYEKYGTSLPIDLWESRAELNDGWEKKLKNTDKVPESCRKYIEFLKSN